MSFVHLNVHTHYSVLEALGKPAEYIAKAKKAGMQALAITDNGVLYGAIEFYDNCKKNDIKPIIGMQISIASQGRFNKNIDNRRYSLILLAKNQIGYKNLLILSTKANLEGFYYVPRIDFELLEQYSKGLIVICGWRFGEITQKLLTNDQQSASEALQKYQQIFGIENVFQEIRNHPEEIFSSEINESLLKFEEKVNLPLVATNHCLYVNSEDSQFFDAFSCIKKGQMVNDPNRLKFLGDYSLKGQEEMKKLFDFCPSAYENTMKIADMVDMQIEFGQNLLPKFELSPDTDLQVYLRALCVKGLEEKYPDSEKEGALRQLDFELKIIHQMGFDSYFLIVWDFIHFAKTRGIVVGPGRGSAAGSITAYCLDITTIDPLKYNLIFERFLNPERISMPDIDIDFSDYRRDEVLEYVIAKYGEEQVAQIITFGTMAAKAAIRDAGRVLGYSYTEVDRIAKMVPPPVLGKYQSLSKYVEEAVELKTVYEKEASAKTILDHAIKFEGTVRNVGTHACAVIISPNKLINHTPIQKAVGDKGGIVTQFSMKPLEKLGLLKMDFLGLSNLSIIEHTINIIKRTHGIELDINSLPLDDKKTFSLFKLGKTTGVFQFESAGMKRYLKDLKPTQIEDLIAMNSLYRPGPMQFIPDYIKGKHGQKKIHYPHSSLEEILKPTYGIAIYQEQILQIAQKFAGFNLGEADLLRRAIGKKISSELLAQRQKFIDGSLKNGQEEKLAIKIFDEVIEPFAGYGFNKAHAACYSMIAYQTAYLKAHFPAEFMAALLSADSSNTDRVAIEIVECENLGIKVYPPSINESLTNFTVVDKETIRFGLGAIKGLGGNTADEIIKIREQGGKFSSISEVAKRVSFNLLNKKTLEALIFSGALEGLGEQNQLAASIESISKFAKNEQQHAASGQIDLFGLIDPSASSEILRLKLNETQPVTEIEKLKREKAYLGIYVSRHPLKGLAKYFEHKVRLLSTLSKKDLTKPLKIGGIISNLKKIFTRSNELMLTFTIEDPTASVDCVIFPKYLKKVGNIFKEDEVIIMNGKLDIRGDKLQYMCSEAKIISLQTMIENAKEMGCYDANEKIAFLGKINFDNKEADINESLDSVNESEPEQILTDMTSNGHIELDLEPYLIEIPMNASSQQMLALKEFLTQNQGKSRNVKLKLPNGHFLNLPVQVDVNSEFEMKVAEILGMTQGMI
ncbi:MAG: polymerase III catalytic subunit, DnaE type, DNA polymerase III subunit alpha protein [Candidatus Peregrinibacteria bacterium GW2011_GWF2_33_10]|nr:MAG: polymerase III catalytic subunit, DnaE type, DNA polymerase III subunit alpha protein [Candidatus Peregrinibacteria bacterium GW2011_GWF2_33_10]OGJ45638.1 MAG: DNA polymerase III subunit alpha [Candidatus Peregrinibacteria bacterium RIFOXYA2_FULL_33_21]OGJ46565.1 MAG: DNA polymerase III subunit alpha [Candidatus Peregrinibacteria bacterium RIFOXYA12_FULL_33_12]OGJ51230.1 MAG: DNA polymerase III subunit alpha [Candidatus Peregrinibacteria bacterium RIFOXYB2_FULL_33_20]